MQIDLSPGAIMAYTILFGWGYLLAYMIKNIKAHFAQWSVIYFLFGIPFLIYCLIAAVDIVDNNSIGGWLIVIGFFFRLFMDGKLRELVDSFLLPLEIYVPELWLGYCRCQTRL